jgi:uncharacterized membrane protein YedE/YeeE
VIHRPPASQHLVVGLIALAMGFSLSSIGFADFSQVHQMFRFDDVRMFLVFIVAVGVLSIVYRVVGRRHVLPKHPVTRRNVAGGVVFGVGWALTGACPSIALVQIGEGRWLAIFTTLGIAAGMSLYRALDARQKARANAMTAVPKPEPA